MEIKEQIIFIILLLMSINTVAQNPKKSESVLINGKMIYYEIHGEGEPLFFLHGYTLSSKSWLPYVDDYDDKFEVYLVDLTGHGRSDTFKEDLSIKSVAKDLGLLVEYLELEKIKAIGFSFGGDVLYQLALLKPSLIESMITIGAIGSWTINDFPEYKESFTFEKRANFSWLQNSHGTDEKIKALMHQFNNYTVYLENEELKSIEPEVFIVLGDDDNGIKLEEIVRARSNLRKSDLWILPNVAHSAHEGINKQEFVIKSKIFLMK